MKQLHVLFSGYVQGIGFRYTTERIGRKFPVTGYVRNLPNGKVELVAEGEERALQDFLKAVEEAFKSFIRGTEVRWKEPAGGWQEFGIKF